MLKRSLVIVAATLVSAHALRAQERKIRVMSVDSVSIPYAYLSVEGGRSQIGDENGFISMGAGKKQTLTLEVRRIGYSPYFGKVELPDTAVTLTIMLTQLSQQLASVKVNGNNKKSSLELAGFYRRWLDGQKGTLSAAFIGPEEIEKRNSPRVSSLLGTVNGITMGHTQNGRPVVQSSGGSCSMAVVVDGRQVCPTAGCRMIAANTLTEQNSVMIDEYVDMGSVAAIEVYKRGGNMPTDFHVDGECGAVVIWTGRRR